MSNLSGLRRLASRCAKDSPVRGDFEAYATASEQGKAIGLKRPSAAALDAAKRLLAVIPQDLNDVVLKSAFALDMLRLQIPAGPRDTWGRLLKLHLEQIIEMPVPVAVTGLTIEQVTDAMDQRDARIMAKAEQEEAAGRNVTILPSAKKGKLH